MTAPATARLSPVTLTDLPCRSSAPSAAPSGSRSGSARSRKATTSLDHEATWLLGHTERITFGELWEGEGDLYVEAVLHVPCRYLRSEEGPRNAGCTATGASPRRPPRRRPQPRRLGGNRFRIVDECQARGDPNAPGGASLRAMRCPVLAARTPAPRRRAGPSDHTTGRRLLPGPAGRDHVHQRATPAGGSGALAPVAVSL